MKSKNDVIDIYVRYLVMYAKKISCIRFDVPLKNIPDDLQKNINECSCISLYKLGDCLSISKDETTRRIVDMVLDICLYGKDLRKDVDEIVNSIQRKYELIAERKTRKWLQECSEWFAAVRACNVFQDDSCEKYKRNAALELAALSIVLEYEFDIYETSKIMIVKQADKEGERLDNSELLNMYINDSKILFSLLAQGDGSTRVCVDGKCMEVTETAAWGKWSAMARIFGLQPDELLLPNSDKKVFLNYQGLTSAKNEVEIKELYRQSCNEALEINNYNKNAMMYGQAERYGEALRIPIVDTQSFINAIALISLEERILEIVEKKKAEKKEMLKREREQREREKNEQDRQDDERWIKEELKRKKDAAKKLKEEMERRKYEEKQQRIEAELKRKDDEARKKKEFEEKCFQLENKYDSLKDDLEKMFIFDNEMVEEYAINGLRFPIALNVDKSMIREGDESYNKSNKEIKLVESQYEFYKSVSDKWEVSLRENEHFIAYYTQSTIFTDADGVIITNRGLYIRNPGDAITVYIGYEDIKSINVEGVVTAADSEIGKTASSILSMFSRKASDKLANALQELKTDSKRIIINDSIAIEAQSMAKSYNGLEKFVKMVNYVKNKYSSIVALNSEANQNVMVDDNVDCILKKASNKEKKFCTECGASIVVGDKFCGACGKKME